LRAVAERVIVAPTSMKWSRRTRTAIAIGIAVALGAAATGVASLQDWGRRATIAYLPFEVITFAAINSSNIGPEATCTLRLPETDADVRELRAIIEGAGSGGFDDGAVRLKIASPFGGTVFVDKHGGVRAKRDGALAEEALKRVTAILERRCPDVGGGTPTP
jgi:hypothetical protein